jgi:hypothetical protein
VDSSYAEYHFHEETGRLKWLLKSLFLRKSTHKFKWSTLSTASEAKKEVLDNAKVILLNGIIFINSYDFCNNIHRDRDDCEIFLSDKSFHIGSLAFQLI